MDQTLKAKIDELIPTLAAVRRDLHKHPESGWTEFRTASMAIKKMQSLGYQITMGADAVDRDSMMGVPSEEVHKKHMARAVSQGADPALVEKMAGGMTGFWADMDFGGEGPFLAVRFDMDCNDVSECADADHRTNDEGYATVNPGPRASSSNRPKKVFAAPRRWNAPVPLRVLTKSSVCTSVSKPTTSAR